MSEPEPTTSTMASPTKFSISTLTSPSTSSPIPQQIPQFPPVAFLQLISQYMARNPFAQPTQPIPSSVNSFPLVHSPINTPESPGLQKNEQKKRKRKRKEETVEKMIDARESEEAPSTSASDSQEKDAAQQLLQNALTQAGQMRERMSSSSRKSLSVSPPAQNVDSDDVVKIKTHPLFPILKLFCEKIETATYDMETSALKMDDVEKLFAELETKKVKPKTGDIQLDEFVYDSIFVLRLQLAEIARVASLSEAFKNNFSASLRKRVNHETLIGLLGDSDEDGSTSDGETTLRVAGEMGSSSNTTVAMMCTPNGTLSIPLKMPPITHHLSHETGSPSGKRRCFDFVSLDTADEI
ncbi:unnamed protein product, partial [Mesorhabditis belari]|uniref:MEIS N-terminal domain-containing protein n=1 Tax=Mesorhabditis belari TaxID=2138241 RepID=A0AAF3FQV6_9BILA